MWFLLSIGLEIDLCAQNFDSRFANPTPGEFPIGVWRLDKADSEPGEEQFRYLRDANMNIAGIWVGDTVKMAEYLKMASKYDVKMVFASSAIGNPNRKKSTLERFRNNPNLLGYFTADEPTGEELKDCASRLKINRAIDPEAIYYINLWPDWYGEHTGINSFRDYVQKYISLCDPPFLSIDLYPVRIRESGESFCFKEYYAFLEVMSQEAKKNNLPLCVVNRCTAMERYHWPDRMTMRFSVFNSLAYGAQGLVWWCYYNPERDIFLESAIMPGYKRSKIWYALKEVNKEVQNLKHVFLGAESVGVWHTGREIPFGTKRLETLPAPFRSLATGSEGVLVSHLKNGDKEYLLIVNHDVNNPQYVSLDNGTAPVWRISSDGKEKQKKSDRIKLDKGNYALLRFR